MFFFCERKSEKPSLSPLTHTVGRFRERVACTRTWVSSVDRVKGSWRLPAGV